MKACLLMNSHSAFKLLIYSVGVFERNFESADTRNYIRIIPFIFSVILIKFIDKNLSKF